MAYDLKAKIHVLKYGYERVTSDYGNRSFNFKGKKYSDFHKGVDLISKKYGTDYITSFADGKVVAIRDSIKGYDEKNSSGNYIHINHTNGYQTRYLHLKKGTLKVKKGDEVKQGQIIAFMNSSGFSTGNHLHFEIRKDGKHLDPKPFLLGEKKIVEVNQEQSTDKNNSSLEFKIGDKVIFTGYLYRDSYGNGKGQKRTNYLSTITKINPSGNCPYNINNGLGWVRSVDIKKCEVRYYTVKSGDTLWAISKKYYNDGSKYYKIAKANNLKSPYIIHSGQKLKIPF